FAGVTRVRRVRVRAGLRSFAQFPAPLKNGLAVRGRTSGPGAGACGAEVPCAVPRAPEVGWGGPWLVREARAGGSRGREPPGRGHRGRRLRLASAAGIRGGPGRGRRTRG